MSELHERHDHRQREDDLDADAERAAKRLRRAERTLDTRQLEPWERYRTLGDVLDSYIDLIEIADRKARFALLILGALNALNFAMLTRVEFQGPGASPRLLGVYVVVYVIVSLFLLTRTVNALKPRVGSFMTNALPGSDSDALGVRFIGNVLRQSASEYYERWLNVEIGEVNREMARQVQLFAGINVEKYRALGHVYNGLIALACLTGAFIAVAIGSRLPR